MNFSVFFYRGEVNFLDFLCLFLKVWFLYLLYDWFNEINNFNNLEMIVKDVIRLVNDNRFVLKFFFCLYFNKSRLVNIFKI